MLIENLAAATEVEIDTELAALSRESELAFRAIDSALNTVHGAAGERQRYVTKRRREWPTSHEDALAAARAKPAGEYVIQYGKTWGEIVAKYDAAIERAAEVRNQQDYYHQEWVRRGGWSRFFTVPAGHIHSSTNCPTCNKGESPTDFGWNPELSGLTEADAVKAKGPHLCTVCFPSAPVEWKIGDEKRTGCSGTIVAGTKRREYRHIYATCTCGTRTTVNGNGTLRKHEPKAGSKEAGATEAPAEVEADAEAPRKEGEIRKGDTVTGLDDTFGGTTTGTVLATATTFDGTVRHALASGKIVVNAVHVDDLATAERAGTDAYTAGRTRAAALDETCLRLIEAANVGDGTAGAVFTAFYTGYDRAADEAARAALDAPAAPAARPRVLVAPPAGAPGDPREAELWEDVPGRPNVKVVYLHSRTAANVSRKRIVDPPADSLDAPAPEPAPPGPGEVEYRIPDHVHATDRRLVAEDRVRRELGEDESRAAVAGQVFAATQGVADADTRIRLRVARVGKRRLDVYDRDGRWVAEAHEQLGGSWAACLRPGEEPTVFADHFRDLYGMLGRAPGQG